MVVIAIFIGIINKWIQKMAQQSWSVNYKQADTRKTLNQTNTSVYT